MQPYRITEDEYRVITQPRPRRAISVAEIGDSRTTAYWPEPSIGQTEWLMAEVDPLPNLCQGLKLSQQFGQK